MGRKIPARKHHGVRDPIKQAAARYQKIKDKINDPPVAQSNKLSYKLNQLVKLKTAAKAGKVKKQLHVQHQEDKPKNRKYKKFNPIVPRDNETESQFMNRVNRITKQGLKEAEYEAKYGVEVIRDDKTGHITVKKRPKDELAELMESNRKRKGKKGIVKKSVMDPKTAKELIKQAIAETKEEEKVEKKKQEEYQRDTFKFGEVVQAPPTLVTPRRAQKNETVPRPGRKDNLLLKKIFNKSLSNEDSAPGIQADSIKNAPKKTTHDLKGRRKDLPTATRQMLENQQTKAIEMYRKLKKDKAKARNELT